MFCRIGVAVVVVNAVVVHVAVVVSVRLACCALRRPRSHHKSTWMPQRSRNFGLTKATLSQIIR